MKNKIVEIIAETQLKHYNGITMPAKKYFESPEILADAILKALKEELPESKKYHLERCTQETRDNWEKAGWNSYRTTLLKKLGGEDE